MIRTKVQKLSMIPVTMLALGLSSFASATPVVDGNTISWGNDGWYQVQNRSTSDYDVCNSSNDGNSCMVPDGTYRVINHSTGERFENIVVSGDAAGGSDSLTQYLAITNIGDTAELGIATLARTQNRVTGSISTTGLNPNNAYSIWMAVFNQPENCVDACNVPDFAATNGTGFQVTNMVSNNSGTGNASFSVDTGSLAPGTFIAAGTGAGIVPGNGVDAEIHLIISDHGPSSEISDWLTEFSAPGNDQQAVAFIR